VNQRPSPPLTSRRFATIHPGPRHSQSRLGVAGCHATGDPGWRVGGFERTSI